jgi:hypothetical protein
MDDDRRTIERLLRGLDVADRLAALLETIIRTNPDAIFVSKSMISATMTLSSRLSLEKRFAIAEALRDAADQLERVGERVV